MRNGNDRTDFGFIAQEVEVLLGTEYNVLGIGGTAERKLSLRYTDFIAPMVKAMQQQQAMIEAQSREIDKLRRALESVLARLPAETTVAAAR
jgi:trimeric autotransporter adhesin